MGKKGIVYLVGAGPGGLGLLTIKAQEVIGMADVILYDQLPGEEIISSLPQTAELIDVGKFSGCHTVPQRNIEALMAEKALSGNVVVRLKGGDPFMFGRGGEEMEMLRLHGIDVKIIPGITSGIAVPECVGIPVTHRDLSSHVTFVTGHEDPNKDINTSVDWKWISSSTGTIVIYMGVKNISVISNQLIINGKSPKTKIAVIERGFRADQRVTCSTLGDIGAVSDKLGIKPPAIIVVGDVVSLYHDGSEGNWYRK